MDGWAFAALASSSSLFSALVPATATNPGKRSNIRDSPPNTQAKNLLFGTLTAARSYAQKTKLRLHVFQRRYK